MATLNPNLILQQQQFKPPSLDFSDALVSAAKIKAYQQQQRLDELKYGQLERSAAKDEAFDRLAAGLFTQPDAAAPAPQARGLAAGPPQGQAAPEAPRGSGYTPMGNMAASVPPPPPGQTYAMPPQQGTWAMRHIPLEDPALADYQSAPVTQQPMAALMGPQGAQLGAVGSPNVPADPPAMNVGMREAPPEAAPLRGLAGGAPSAAAPGAASAPPAPGEPAGLGAAQPGAPKSLLQPLNERVLMQLYATNPEKAAKLMEGHLKMQEQKLTTSEKMNEQVYQVLTALQNSRNPAEMYPRALEALRERGIPIPASFPKTYDPALIAFKMKEHETLKNQIDLAKIELDRQKAIREQAEASRATAEAGRVPTQQRADEALIAQREAETKRTGLQGQEDVARTTKLQEETTALINERKAKAGQVTPYTTDADWNVYLSQAMKEAGLPPGTSPNDHPAVIAKARQYQVEDKQNVVRKTGMDAIQQQQGPAATKRLEASNAKGSSAEAVMNVLDEVERLIDEGVYENVPEEKAKQLLFLAGLRPDDPKAARTKRLYELGNQLTVGMAPNGSLGAGMSEGDRLTFERAGGDLQRSQAALSRKETIKSMRALGKINMHDANRVWETHDKTGEFPRFGSAREERLKILTPERLEEVWQAKKAGWSSKEALRQHLLGQGFREE